MIITLEASNPCTDFLSRCPSQGPNNTVNHLRGKSETLQFSLELFKISIAAKITVYPCLRPLILQNHPEQDRVRLTLSPVANSVSDSISGDNPRQDKKSPPEQFQYVLFVFSTLLTVPLSLEPAFSVHPCAKR